MDELLDISLTGSTPAYERSLSYRIQSPPQFDESIWFFGCSHVYGYTLPREQTAPYFLEKLLRIKTLNLGVPRSGVDLIFENMSRLLKKYKPKAIVTAYPDLSRKMFLVDGKPVLFTAMHLGPNPPIYFKMYRQKYVKEYIQYEGLIKRDTLHKENLEIIKSIRNLAQDNDILHVEFSYKHNYSDKISNVRDFDMNLEWLDVAPDGWHPGPLTQELIANWVCEQLQLKNIHER